MPCPWLRLHAIQAVAFDRTLSAEQVARGVTFDGIRFSPMETATKTLIADKIRSRTQLKDWEIAKLLRRHNVVSSDVALVRASMNDKTGAPAAITTSRPRVRSLSDFRRMHDIPQKIRDTLAGIKTDGYVTEEELRHLCEVPVSMWRRNADLPEFSSNKFKLDGVTYWASPETIKQMKLITGRA